MLMLEKRSTVRNVPQCVDYFLEQNQQCNQDASKLTRSVHGTRTSEGLATNVHGNLQEAISKSRPTDTQTTRLTVEGKVGWDLEGLRHQRGLTSVGMLIRLNARLPSKGWLHECVWRLAHINAGNTDLLRNKSDPSRRTGTDVLDWKGSTQQRHSGARTWIQQILSKEASLSEELHESRQARSTESTASIWLHPTSEKPGVAQNLCFKLLAAVLGVFINMYGVLVRHFQSKLISVQHLLARNQGNHEMERTQNGSGASMLHQNVAPPPSSAVELAPCAFQQTGASEQAHSKRLAPGLGESKSAPSPSAKRTLAPIPSRDAVKHAQPRGFRISSKNSYKTRKASKKKSVGTSVGFQKGSPRRQNWKWGVGMAVLGACLGILTEAFLTGKKRQPKEEVQPRESPMNNRRAEENSPYTINLETLPFQNSDHTLHHTPPFPNPFPMPNYYRPYRPGSGRHITSPSPPTPPTTSSNQPRAEAEERRAFPSPLLSMPSAVLDRRREHYFGTVDTHPSGGTIHQRIRAATDIQWGLHRRGLPLTVRPGSLVSPQTSYTGVETRPSGQERSGGGSGFGLFSTVREDASTGQWVGYQVFCALGIGPLFGAPLSPLLAPLPTNRAASALALFSFTRSFVRRYIHCMTAPHTRLHSNATQNSLQKNLPAAFVAQFPPGFEIAYAAIPVIRQMEEPLRTEVPMAATVDDTYALVEKKEEANTVEMKEA
ncbi:hypothetical protein C8R47DRAFT_1204823 [Mycena vitilis]|nr:hypothetical protein C8R47DRAFT_1204823 [Mycena vitilis]